jgi:hypothetical protein
MEETCYLHQVYRWPLISNPSFIAAVINIRGCQDHDWVWSCKMNYFDVALNK